MKITKQCDFLYCCFSIVHYNVNILFREGNTKQLEADELVALKKLVQSANIEKLFLSNLKISENQWKLYM